MQSFFMRMTKTLIRLTDAQADLSLYWEHMSEDTFFMLSLLWFALMLMFVESTHAIIKFKTDC